MLLQTNPTFNTTKIAHQNWAMESSNHGLTKKKDPIKPALFEQLSLSSNCNIKHWARSTQFSWNPSPPISQGWKPLNLYLWIDSKLTPHGGSSCAEGLSQKKHRLKRSTHTSQSQWWMAGRFIASLLICHILRKIDVALPHPSLHSSVMAFGRHTPTQAN